MRNYFLVLIAMLQIQTAFGAETRSEMPESPLSRMESCMQDPAVLPESEPQNSDGVKKPQYIADQLEAAMKGQLKSMAINKTMTEAFKKSGVKPADKTAGDILAVYALFQDLQSLSKAKTDLQKFDALNSTAATVVGYFFPQIGMLMKADQYVQAVVGEWSVADDRANIDKLYIELLKVQYETATIKWKEQIAAGKAVKRLHCENREVRLTLKVLETLYARLNCGTPFENLSGDRQAHEIASCITLGREMLKNLRFSHYLVGRQYMDPFMLRWAETRAPTEREDFHKKRDSHFKMSPVLDEAYLKTAEQVEKLYKLALTPDEFSLRQQREEAKHLQFCRGEKRQRARQVVMAWKNYSEDPETFELSLYGYKRISEHKCPAELSDQYTELIEKLEAENR